MSKQVVAIVGVKVLDDIAKKGCRELWVNPGADGPKLIQKAWSLR